MRPLEHPTSLGEARWQISLEGPQTLYATAATLEGAFRQAAQALVDYGAARHGGEASLFARSSTRGPVGVGGGYRLEIKPIS